MLIKNISKVLRLFSTRTAFNFEHNYYTYRLRNVEPNIFQVSLFIFLELNKEEMFESYKKGIGVHSQIKIHVTAIRRRLTRKPSNEVFKKYQKWCDRINTREEHKQKQKEINEFINKFPEYKPNLELFEEAEIINTDNDE